MKDRRSRNQPANIPHAKFCSNLESKEYVSSYSSFNRSLPNNHGWKQAHEKQDIAAATTFYCRSWLPPRLQPLLFLLLVQQLRAPIRHATLLLYASLLPAQSCSRKNCQSTPATPHCTAMVKFDAPHHNSTAVHSDVVIHD
ncbi:unnamed protein product [Prunus armeniaca]